MRKYKDQQQSFLSITASKSAASHNLFVNKLLYGLRVYSVTFYAVLQCVLVSLRCRICHRRVLVHRRSIDRPLQSLVK